MSVVIGGGEFGGRVLRTPSGIRPTSGRVRQALFNMLGARVEGARVLDLFAGSGALGLEAISRGADSAHLVERDPRRAEVIAQNIESLGLKGRARVQRGAAQAWLERHPESVAEMDLVLMDPEYPDQAGLLRILEWLDQPGRMARGALLVVEHSSRLDLSGSASHLNLARTVRYGDTALSFFEPGAAGQEGRF